MKPEKELMKFACSMSRSIDPRRPWKLTTVKSGYNEFGYNEYLDITNFCSDFLKLGGVK